VTIVYLNVTVRDEVHRPTVETNIRRGFTVTNCVINIEQYGVFESECLFFSNTECKNFIKDFRNLFNFGKMKNRHYNHLISAQNASATGMLQDCNIHQLVH